MSATAGTMPPSPEQSSPDPDADLPGMVLHAMVRDLVQGLPDPIEDTPEARAERDHAAIAEVAMLAPADGPEIRIAIRCVTADAGTNAHLRRMNIHSEDVPTHLRFSVQATTTGRAANANRALLQRVQTQRRKRRPDATDDADAQAERRARDGLMRAWHELAHHLMQKLPKAQAVAAPSGARPAAHGGAMSFEQAVAERRQEVEVAAAAGEPEPGWVTPAWRLTLGLPEPPPPAEDQQPHLRLLEEADRYAVVYPMRTRLIRRLGNLPPDCGLEQPPPDLLNAIRSGSTRNLLWADRLTPAEARLHSGLDREMLGRYEEAAAEPAGPG